MEDLDAYGISIKKANKFVLDEEPMSFDAFVDMNINLRNLARKKRFGHIALTSSISPSNAQNTPSGTSKSVSCLTTLASFPSTLEALLNSQDIKFFIKLANVFRGDIDDQHFPYFVVDLYLLLYSWEKESFNTSLIDGYYSARLDEIIQKYTS